MKTITIMVIIVKPGVPRGDAVAGERAAGSRAVGSDYLSGSRTRAVNIL